jgi:hypothetical protein
LCRRRKLQAEAASSIEEEEEGSMLGQIFSGFATKTVDIYKRLTPI